MTEVRYHCRHCRAEIVLRPGWGGWTHRATQSVYCDASMIRKAELR